MVSETYELLEAKVAEIPAKGKLAEFSRRKYGPRSDQSKQAMAECFENLKSKLVTPPIKLMSDAKPSYGAFVDQYFTQCIHEVHNGSQKERHRDRLHEKLI